MRIRANIANGYPMVYELKQTHVLNQDGHALMEQVIMISDTYELNPEETLGYIIYRLHPKPLQFQPQPSTRTVRVDYTDDDEKVDAWYAKTKMSNNQLSTQFILMWMRLSLTYGNSLSELLYLLRQVDEDANWTPQVPQPEMAMPAGMGYSQMGYGQMGYGQMPMMAPMNTPMPNSVDSDDSDAESKPAKKRGFKITKAPQSRAPRSVTSKSATNTTTADADAESQVSSPASSSAPASNGVAEQLASLEAKRKQIEETDKATDEVIKKNPMFDDFFNRNDK